MKGRATTPQGGMLQQLVMTRYCVAYFDRCITKFASTPGRTFCRACCRVFNFDPLVGTLTDFLCPPVAGPEGGRGRSCGTCGQTRRQ